MAQHDFVPAWLNFTTPQSAKSPAATFEKHGKHLSRGEGRFGVSRWRHNSSNVFFNNGPLRTLGDSCHQPSLLCHNSVDSGVSKGTLAGLSWHGSGRGHDGMRQRGRGRAATHPRWNGSFNSHKASALQEKPPTKAREEKKEEKADNLQFEEEDFPSLNAEAGKENHPSRPVGTPSGLWDSPLSSKQRTKMLVTKKVSKEEPAAAFSAAFTSSGPHLANGNKPTTVVPNVYKNLVPKPAAPTSKPRPWKVTRTEHKAGLLSSSQDSAFTSPVAVTKPAVLASGSVLPSPKESPSSTTPPIEINSCHLTKLTCRNTEKKSEFLKTLTDDPKIPKGEISENRECDKLEDMEGNSTAQPKENGKEGCHQDALTLPLMEKREGLSLSLEAEHRLLKAMGWQEYPENEENCLPLTEDELREFHMKTEKLRRNGFGSNSFSQSRCLSGLFATWRNALKPEAEDSGTETSSSETSDD